MKTFNRSAFLLAAFLIASIIEKGDSNFVAVKAYPECDQWAADGECLKNPNFMWTSCHAR